MVREWKELSPAEKSSIIKESIANGVSSLKQIRDTYSLYSNGNHEHGFGDYLKQLLAEPHLLKDGGAVRNWDNTFTGKLINAVENPDSVGYKTLLGTQEKVWYHPVNPVDENGKEIKLYDTNQWGMGVDKNETPGFWDYAKKDKNKEIYLTELDERKLRHNAIEAANKSANARYEFAKTRLGRTKYNVSRVKDAAVVSAIYNLGAGHVANGLFEDDNFMKLLFDGTDQQVVNRINQEYKKKGRNERIQRTNDFLGYTHSTGGHLYQDGSLINQVDVTAVTAPSLQESLPRYWIDVDGEEKLYSELSDKGKQLANKAMLYETNQPLEIVSPEFDLLTLGRSIAASPLVGTHIEVHPGEYFRVVGRDAIKDAQKVGVLRVPTESRLDMNDVSRISKMLNVSKEKILRMPSEEQIELMKTFKSRQSSPTIARLKSNHGDIGFQKEGFFYFPERNKATAVIKGTENNSTFLGGHHGSYTGLINKEIYPESPAVLREGFESTNFTKWQPALLYGWRETPLLETVGTTALRDAAEIIPPNILAPVLEHNIHSTGGLLYPFSFKPIPAVRY